jgi:hypothetical protein
MGGWTPDVADVTPPKPHHTIAAAASAQYQRHRANTLAGDGTERAKRVPSLAAVSAARVAAQQPIQHRNPGVSAVKPTSRPRNIRIQPRPVTEAPAEAHVSSHRLFLIPLPV